MSLDWKGDKVTDKVTKAQIEGVNATMAECIIDAKNSHEWKNRTGTLEGSIDVAQHARAEVGGVVVGEWGSLDVEYAIYHELGTATIPARPYLRPAADRNYPNLARNIRRAL